LFAVHSSVALGLYGVNWKMAVTHRSMRVELVPRQKQTRGSGFSEQLLPKKRSSCYGGFCHDEFAAPAAGQFLRSFVVKSLATKETKEQSQEAGGQASLILT
jgi:hypothetical protein